MLTEIDLLLCLEYVDCEKAMSKTHNTAAPIPLCASDPNDSAASPIGATVHGRRNIRTYWVVIYGGLLVLLLIGMAVAAVFHMTTITRHIAHAGSHSGVKKLLISQATFLGLIGALFLAERRYPAGPMPTIRTWLLNFKIYMAFVIVTPFVGVLLGICAGYVSQIFNLGLINIRFPEHWSVAGAVTAYFIWAFASDFFYYWFHRFQHESFFWHQHKLHHLDETLCAITTGRNHWLEGLLYIPARLIPLAILIKLDPASGGIIGGVITFFESNWRMFNHSNIRIGFGCMSWLLTSPQMHRVHHSRLPEHQNKNYASVFSILDVLFGTYYHPRRDEFPPTGVPGERDVRTISEALTLPFREWWLRLCAWRRGRAYAMPNGEPLN